jgi:hypothetical protein
VPEPTNMDLMVAITELRGDVRAVRNEVDSSVKGLGREVADLRSQILLAKAQMAEQAADIAALDKRSATAVTWKGVGALIAVVIPVLAFVLTIAAGPWR